MVTVSYSSHGFIHMGTTFMYLQYRPLIYYILPNVCRASYTISASIFVDVPYWPLYSTISASFVLHQAPRSGSFTMAKNFYTLQKWKCPIGPTWINETENDNGVLQITQEDITERFHLGTNYIILKDSRKTSEEKMNRLDWGKKRETRGKNGKDVETTENERKQFK